MVNFIKGIIATLVVLVLAVGVSVICEKLNFEINQVIMATVAAVVGMMLYDRLTGKKTEN